MELPRPFDAEAGAQLIEMVGSPEFAPALLRAANSISQVDELFGYLVSDGEDPETIISASSLRGSERRVATYVKRFYRHDPAVHEFGSLSAGESFVRRIPISHILAHDYRRICFSRPGFCEKLTFGWRGKGYMLVLSFYRRDASDAAALQNLASLVALIVPVMVRHHAPIDRENAVLILERRIRRSYAELSRREGEICARTILGRSAEQIAAELGIAAGSVLTYRQRAYAKCDISAAGELVPMLLN